MQNGVSLKHHWITWAQWFYRTLFIPLYYYTLIATLKLSQGTNKTAQSEIT